MEDQETTRTCFVIGPVGPRNSPVRHRSEQVLQFLIKPVVEPLGYTVVRADKQATPGIITNQIINQAIDAPLVIADLSDGNGNAFYELAIRHVTQKPLVQLLLDGQELPFDIKAMRTVFFDMTDPFKIEESKKELLQHVKAAEEGEPIETPISNALELKAYRSSGDGLERSVAELATEMAEIRAEMRAAKPYYALPSVMASGHAGPSRLQTAAFTGLAPTAYYNPDLLGASANIGTTTAYLKPDGTWVSSEPDIDEEPDVEGKSSD